MIYYVRKSMVLTDNPKNARPDILDTIELIANQIAICSHFQELINVGRVDIEHEEEAAKATEMYEKTQKIEILLFHAVELRRKLMSQLEQEVAVDHKMWCAVKHAIASYQYATEVMYAHNGKVKYEKNQQEAYEQMIQVLSLWTGQEMVTCGRCWLDNMTENGG